MDEAHGHDTRIDLIMICFMEAEMGIDMVMWVPVDMFDGRILQWMVILRMWFYIRYQVDPNG